MLTKCPLKQQLQIYSETDIYSGLDKTGRKSLASLRYFSLYSLQQEMEYTSLSAEKKIDIVEERVKMLEESIMNIIKTCCRTHVEFEEECQQCYEINKPLLRPYFADV